MKNLLKIITNKQNNFVLFENNEKRKFLIDEIIFKPLMCYE
jgi:hypothetical protein